MLAATSDLAWLRRLLDFESALARVEARLELIPAEAAEKISARCHVRFFDVDKIGKQAAADGNPVIPLVRALAAEVKGEAAGYVHWGATSQDALDTAMMLVARDALDLIIKDAERVAAACANLADKHRATVMAARTLLQQALPTTFGLKATGWLNAVLEADEMVRDIRVNELALQLGGAAGTLAAFGDKGLQVGDALALELGLNRVDVPWHTDRLRVVGIGQALAGLAGVMSKIALDVALLSQTEVAEVVEPAPGGSSALPHKRNPVGSALVRACARGVWAQAHALTTAMEQEQERAAGAWQSEWTALGEALRCASGAVATIATVLEGLVVDEARMRANLEAAGGVLMSESVMMALAPKVGRTAAREMVEKAVKATAGGEAFKEALAAEVRDDLSQAELEAALDPSGYLGAAEELVERTLRRYRGEKSGHDKHSKSAVRGRDESPA
jgi:3-carboxy-cis,cis-muconate cycloisomerase